MVVSSQRILLLVLIGRSFQILQQQYSHWSLIQMKILPSNFPY